LYETGSFRSLTYRDMPFVLMPNTWKMLSIPFRRHQDAKQRAHKDRILVNFDSPEAFEEVFWRTFCGKDYIRTDHLKPHTVDADTTCLFRDYVRQVVASAEAKGQSRYLSKNNNNLLRLSTIRDAFPNAVIVVPFRDPVQQSSSLLAQHLLFSELQKEDRFSYDYMCWLAHHEFGMTHKASNFGSEKESFETSQDPQHINYWLRHWCHSYEHVLSTIPNGLIFVSYEKLCADPDGLINTILGLSGLKGYTTSMKTDFREAKRREVTEVNEDLKAKAFILYRRMLER